MKSKDRINTTTTPVSAIDGVESEAVIEQRPLAVAVKNAVRANGTPLSSIEKRDEPESAWVTEQRRRIAVAKAELEDFERKRLAHLSDIERAVLSALEARCRSIAKRNSKFDSAVLSAMGTLATADGIASAIAAKHKISEIDVFLLGANYLREVPTGTTSAIPALRESAFLARSLVIARARILIERSRATALLGLKDAMWDEKVNKAQQEEAERQRLEALVNAGLAKGREIANSNRIQLSINRKAEATRVLQEWRAHSNNATADKDVGFEYVAKIFNGWGYVTSRGTKFKANTIKEYFRRPRQT